MIDQCRGYKDHLVAQVVDAQSQVCVLIVDKVGWVEVIFQFVNDLWVYKQRSTDYKQGWDGFAIERDEG